MTWGLVCIAGFVVLRTFNLYGDPVPWTTQDTTAFTVLSFLNTNKYPPSLLFLLMTLGPALLILRGIDRTVPAWLRPMLVYGRVPFFYYFVHFGLIHVLAALTAQVRNGSMHYLFESPTLGRYPFTPPPDWGFSLPVVYAIWIAVAIVLYWPCKRMAHLKATGRHPWLSYL
jgi:hypothetical protein